MKRTCVANLVASVFGEKDADQGDRTGTASSEAMPTTLERADDGVEHPATGIACGWGDWVKKPGVRIPGKPFDDDEEEEHEDRDGCQHHAEDDQRADHPVTRMRTRAGSCRDSPDPEKPPDQKAR